MKLDKIDTSILIALQNNARMPNIELANRVGLSPSACSRRVEHLVVNRANIDVTVMEDK